MIDSVSFLKALDTAQLFPDGASASELSQIPEITKQLTQQNVESLGKLGCKFRICNLHPHGMLVIPSGWFVCCNVIGDEACQHITARHCLKEHLPIFQEQLTAIVACTSGAGKSQKTLQMMQDLVSVNSS